MTPILDQKPQRSQTLRAFLRFNCQANHRAAEHQPRGGQQQRSSRQVGAGR